jgi:hypothetical protein
MNNKRSTRSLVKLPKLGSSPEKGRNRSVKGEEQSKFTAAAYGIYSAELVPVAGT